MKSVCAQNDYLHLCRETVLHDTTATLHIAAVSNDIIYLYITSEAKSFQSKTPRNNTGARSLRPRVPESPCPVLHRTTGKQNKTNHMIFQIQPFWDAHTPTPSDSKAILLCWFCASLKYPPARVPCESYSSILHFIITFIFQLNSYVRGMQFYLQQPSGQAVVTGAISSSLRYVP